MYILNTNSYREDIKGPSSRFSPSTASVDKKLQKFGEKRKFGDFILFLRMQKWRAEPKSISMKGGNFPEEVYILSECVHIMNVPDMDFHCP